MYENIQKEISSGFRVNNSTVGKPLEQKIREYTEKKKAIEADEVPMIYTGSHEPMAGTDIRSDRFEIAREAKEKLANIIAQKTAKAEEMGKIYDEETDKIVVKENELEETERTSGEK